MVRFHPRSANVVTRTRGDCDRRWEPGEVFSLRTADLKCIFHSEGEDELYDLRTDPLEQINLVSEPSESGRRMLARLLILFQQMSREGDRLGDGVVLPGNHEELKALGLPRTRRGELREIGLPSHLCLDILPNRPQPNDRPNPTLAPSSQRARSSHAMVADGGRSFQSLRLRARSD